MSEFLLLRHRNIGEEGIAELDEYLRLGGFQAFRTVSYTHLRAHET